MGIAAAPLTLQVATSVVYDRNGRVVKTAPAARDSGTTVLLENLFASLPVRYKVRLRELAPTHRPSLCLSVPTMCPVQGMKDR